MLTFYSVHIFALGQFGPWGFVITRRPLAIYRFPARIMWALLDSPFPGLTFLRILHYHGRLT